MRLRSAAVSFVILVLAGCGGGEAGEAVATATVTAKTSAAGGSVAEIDPCAVLDEVLVRRHFDVGDAEITSRQSTRTHHPLCTLTWRKPNAEQLEKEMQAKLTEYMAAKARGEDVAMPSFKTDNEVSLTINMPPSETSEAAAVSFQAAMRTLEEGFRDKDNPDAPPRFQYDTDPVEGVADQASWTPGLSQLSVQSGRYVFHVTVDVGEETANQERAKTIATEIAERLTD